MTLTAIKLAPDCPADILDHLDPRLTPGFDGTKAEGIAETNRLRKKLIELQDKLYASDKHRLLVILQAMDTGGKDGAIRKVFSGVNPSGMRVVRFEAPTSIQLAHDYLWRIHMPMPARRELVIFNRSQYEDVLVVRVNHLVPERVWRRRYGQIRDFERMLVEEGMTIVKFYLHIDRAEQRKRLEARLADPDKRWKFDMHDLEQRKKWPEYMVAYRDAIVKTDRPDSPWFVIPAGRKWYRDYAIMRIVVDTLDKLHLKYPTSTIDPATIHID